MLTAMTSGIALVDRDPLICVVDDHESVREALIGLLRSLGLRVAVFESAESFRDSNELATTDCLILDIHLPGMSGPALMRELRASELTIPVILITGRFDDVARRLLAEAPDHGLLVKPFDEDELLAALEAALRPRLPDDEASHPRDSATVR